MLYKGRENLRRKNKSNSAYRRTKAQKDHNATSNGARDQ